MGAKPASGSRARSRVKDEQTAHARENRARRPAAQRPAPGTWGRGVVSKLGARHKLYEVPPPCGRNPRTTGALSVSRCPSALTTAECGAVDLRSAAVRAGAGVRRHHVGAAILPSPSSWDFGGSSPRLAGEMRPSWLQSRVNGNCKQLTSQALTATALRVFRLLAPPERVASRQSWVRVCIAPGWKRQRQTRRNRRMLMAGMSSRCPITLHGLLELGNQQIA